MNVVAVYRKLVARGGAPIRAPMGGSLRMKRTIRVMSAAVLIVVLASAASASAASKGTNRPFMSTGSSSGPVNFFTGDFVADGSTIGTAIGAGTVHTVGNVFAGYSSTTTAADGDTFSAVSAEELDPSGVTCPAGTSPTKARQTITGGTGRFVDATGSLVVTSCSRFDVTNNGLVLTFSFTTVGTISY